MGSRLNVILKRDGLFTVSYNRIRAVNVPAFLAFGPLAAWESLTEHQRSAALFKSSASKTEWSNNTIVSVAQIIEAGNTGSVIMDWDDKVLWYFTDFDPERYGEVAWGSWFASWVDVFWPNWTILRPRTLSFRDICKRLGFKTELHYFKDWQDSNNYEHEIEFYQAKDEADNSKFQTYIAVVQNKQLKFHRIKSGYRDDLMYLGPNSISSKLLSYPLSFEALCSPEHHISICALVDFDKKQSFFSGGFHGEDANPFSAWPGWNAKSDRQGFFSWITNTDTNFQIDREVFRLVIDAYFEGLLKGCTEVGPTNNSIQRSLRDISISHIREPALEDNPFPRTADSTGSFSIRGEDDNSDIKNWIEVSRANQKIRAENYREFYKQMKPVYLSDSQLKDRLFKDRHHSYFDWEPDLEAYAALNEINPNITKH